MATGQLQTPIARGSSRTWKGAAEAIEARLEAERERIGLWLPVALGAGIAAWFALPATMHWIGLLLLLASGILGGLLIGWHRRLGRVIIVGCGAVAIGLLLVWARALGVAAPVLAAPVTTEFAAVVERVEPLPAKGKIRILAAPQRRSDLPPRVRLTLRGEQAVDLVGGEAIGVRARLMPPPTASLPGGYDFAQRAWFDGIGAVGTVLGKVSRASERGAAAPSVRVRLSAHIHDQVEGSAGGIAAALVTGDRGAISEADRHNIRGERISVDTIPLVGEEALAGAVRAVGRLPRARVLVLAGALMGGSITAAVRDLQRTGVLVISLNMAGSVPEAADLVVTDPLQAGVMAVMAIADTATFDLSRQRQRRY